MILSILITYACWVTIGCVIAVATARLAYYTVDSNRDYDFLGFLALVSMGPLLHFWLKKRGY